jgi:hypothetical protein
LPARAESLAVTERYRSGMVRLRQQGQREAKRIWNGVDPDDLDATFNLGTLELTVTTLQREAARLSSAYLSTFIASELGEPERPPALSVWDKAFGGGDLREALRSAVIKTKVAIGEGDDPREATNRNRIVLVNDVGLFIDTAARESLRQGMEMDERIVGYQRALKGTCGACAGNVAVETSVELPSIPLRIHPNCQCVTEPVVQPRRGRPSETQQAAIQWYETGYGVEDMTALRVASGDITKLGAEAQARVRNLTNVIDANTERAPTLYRVVDNAKLPAEIRTALFGRGREFRDWGLNATSANEQFPATWIRSLAEVGNRVKKPVIFRINGGRGMDVEKLAKRLGWEIDEGPGAGAGVKEWWLRPGTKYRVTSSRKTSRGLEVSLDVIE